MRPLKRTLLVLGIICGFLVVALMTLVVYAFIPNAPGVEWHFPDS